MTRGGELCICILCLPILLLLGLCIYAVNLWANPGPLIYCQTRIGRGEVPFTILKFRSMARPGRAGGYASDQMDNIPPWGRILRASHVDELPQIINIIKGDMALFGPRPEQPQIYRQLCHHIPCYRLRSLQHPGLLSTVQAQPGYIATPGGQLRRSWYDRQDRVLNRAGDRARLLWRTLCYITRQMRR